MIIGSSPLHFSETKFWEAGRIVGPQVRDPACWHNLFTDLRHRLNLIYDNLHPRANSLSEPLQIALNGIKDYLHTLDTVIKEGRTDLYPILERWGVNCLATLAEIIHDNLLIMGAGPVGLTTAYFLKMTVPSLKVVLLEKRAEYTRGYSVLLKEEVFETLPPEIQKAVWSSQSGFGCYVLPPPIDAKGYCFINPPHDLLVPHQYYTAWFPDEYFDVDPLTGHKTIKRFMTIPVAVFETAMAELLTSRFPDVQIVHTGQNASERYNSDPQLKGLNRLEIWEDNQKKAGPMFNNDYMYNYVVDATGASSQRQRNVSRESDWAMTVLVKHDAHSENTVKIFNAAERNIYLQPPQHRSRFFTPNIKWKQALLSLRELPASQPKKVGQLMWENLVPETQTLIKSAYQGYLGRELNPDDVIKISMFNIRLGAAPEVYTKYTIQDTTINKFTLGDAACAVHFFTGTGINFGIEMASALSEVFAKVYQSRWTMDPTKEFQDWNQKMVAACQKTLEYSRPFVN